MSKEQESKARGQAAARSEQEEWAAQGLSPNDPWIQDQIADSLETRDTLQRMLHACAEGQFIWPSGITLCEEDVRAQLAFSNGILSSFD